MVFVTRSLTRVQFVRSPGNCRGATKVTYSQFAATNVTEGEKMDMQGEKYCVHSIACSNDIHVVNAQPEGGRTKLVVRGTQTLTTKPTLKARLLQPVW